MTAISPSDSPPTGTVAPRSPDIIVLVLLPSGATKLPIYEAIRRELNVELAIVHTTPRAPPFADVFHHWIHLQDIHDPDALDNAISDYFGRGEQEQKRIKAVISFQDYGVYPAAVVAERRSLTPIPLPSRLILEMVDKSRFRGWCRQYGVSSPQSLQISEAMVDAHPASDVDWWLGLMQKHGITLPVIVKPTAGVGKLQVSRVNTVVELHQRLQSLFAAVNAYPKRKYLRFTSGSVTALVEEYIRGQEVDIDALVQHGKVVFSSITDNFPSPIAELIETGGLAPSALPKHAQDKLQEVFRSWIASVPEYHGVVHFEAKYDKERDRAYVIEANLRLGAAEVNTFILEAFHVNLGLSAAHLALGLPVPMNSCSTTDDYYETLSNRPTTRYFASVKFFAPFRGVLRNCTMPTQDPNYVDGGLSLGVEPGALVVPPSEGGYILCWMVGWGNDSIEAKRQIERLTLLTKVGIDKVSPYIF